MSTSFSLLCLPFAGAGASFYFPWRDRAADGIDVVPVQLPGRERLIAEDPYTDMHAAADRLAARLDPALKDRPVALFGHSLGAVLAFELALRLEADGFDVVHLVASGSQGPWHGRTERAGDLDDDEFVARVREFAGYRHPAFDIPEMRELLLPTLRADVAMHESYVPTEGGRLRCDITSVRGVEDHLVSPEAAAGWALATAGTFHAVGVAGGHMYLEDDPAVALDAVAGAVGLLGI
ncbi:putative thioesterase [Alloactinosynnema sp. L-07]|uniref:thioesterase II family protein n=1 Tax=Alloactinosynnema sp. L-07 TaxID=1653480 RepID=UPI00065EF91E|nr:alpha/beta fold hydrolase [Alloactinosynnema sp. L-07]CRK56696.1 putative thioesterase [Alloactinosynnema sp. L-07]